MKSAFKIILVARFCSFTSLVRLEFVVLSQTTHPIIKMRVDKTFLGPRMF